MLNYFKYINDILLLNKNKYVLTEKLYKKFKNIIKGEKEDENMEYLFLLHVMTYKTRLENYFVKIIRGMNNTVLYIGIFDDDKFRQDNSSNNKNYYEKSYQTSKESEPWDENDESIEDDIEKEESEKEESEEEESEEEESEEEESEEEEPEEEEYEEEESKEDESEEDESEEDESEEEESEDETLEDNELDNDLFSLISRNDVIDYVIENIENTYLKILLQNYREYDNNIMHILFLNGKNKEIEKLLDINTFHLLIEKNNDNQCPIDYIDKNNLKNILKECISVNINLNDDIEDLYYKQEIINKNNHLLYLSVNYLTIILGTSLIYIFGNFMN